MNIIKSIFSLLTFTFLLITTPSNAQFFEKLAKKAEKKIEREAEKRAERRVNKKIDKTFDGAENTIDGKNKKTQTKSKDLVLPENYFFDWKYTLKMETKKGDVKMHYMLKNNADYFGIVLVLDEVDTKQNSITIMDFGRKAFITLLDTQGQKVIRTTKIPSENFEENDEKTKEFKITKTDTKVILGYTCQGIKMEMDDGIMHMYVAKNAPVSFNKAFSSSKNIPTNLNQKLQKELENGIMLEAEFISNKKKKHNFKTTCIELKKMKFQVRTSEYKSLSELKF